MREPDRQREADGEDGARGRCPSRASHTAEARKGNARAAVSTGIAAATSATNASSARFGNIPQRALQNASPPSAISYMRAR